MVVRRFRSPSRALVALAAFAVGLAIGACDGSSPASSGSGEATAAPTCRLAGALHEHQLVQSPGLRATPGDVVVGRLEAAVSGAPVPAAGSGGPGVDVLPYRIAADTDFEVGIGDGGTAGVVRLLDASGRIVA